MVVQAASPASSSAASEKNGQAKIDRATCQLIIDHLKAHQDELDADLKAIVAKARNTDCTVASGDEVADAPDLVAMAATWCNSVERFFAIKLGPASLMHARMKAWMCGDGSRVWKYAEPYCYVTSIPLYSGASDRCMVLNNNTYVATLHNEFHIFPWPVPFFNRYGWFEYRVYAPGVWANPYGFCCN